MWKSWEVGKDHDMSDALMTQELAQLLGGVIHATKAYIGAWNANILGLLKSKSFEKKAKKKI